MVMSGLLVMAWIPMGRVDSLVVNFRWHCPQVFWGHLGLPMVMVRCPGGFVCDLQSLPVGYYLLVLTSGRW